MKLSIHSIKVFISYSTLSLVALGTLNSRALGNSIVGGEPVPECGWPTTIYTDGCTGTLIHPKAISTAQHCGEPSSISFGPEGRQYTTQVKSCVSQGSEDAMICELEEEITEIPITPVVFGCEVEKYLKSGTDVVIAGYGMLYDGGPSGTKYWANQKINRVEESRVIVGEGGDGTSPCRGDSGGPVFLQVDDGSWRVFGTVLSGTTGIPCNSAADFQRIDQVVPYFEEETGIDVTPCFDGATGEWDPSEDCGGFFAGSEEGQGNWSNWCEGTPASGPSSECGEAYGDVSVLFGKGPEVEQSKYQPEVFLHGQTPVNPKQTYWNVQGTPSTHSFSGTLPAGVYLKKSSTLKNDN